jgi:hypothetical protein
VAALIELSGVIVMSTSKGAPGFSASIVEDEPMCRQITVPVSWHAAKNGSQWSVKMLGQPSADGSSLNVTALQPFAATRWISFAINCGSQIGGTDSGMKRPGYVPHHSSMCQSLYACNSTWPTSRSFDRENNWPQNDTKLGKHMDASSPLRSMSFTRAWMS